MRQIQHFGICILSAFVVLVASSCKKEVSSESEVLITSNAAAAAQKNADAELLKSVRQATSRYHSTTQAIKAGYLPTQHCASHPTMGGMGYHWVNPTLVDGTFDAQNPEALLYARNSDGNLKLVAVEYIVLRPAQNPQKPSFGTQEFDNAGAPGMPPSWTLHVWLYEHNPSGMFAPFNPNITCQ